MKILVLSDLHLEFLPLVPDETAADVVVLAGDIDLGLAGIEWGRASFPDKDVVYVAGNHEFYGHDWNGLRDQMRQEAHRQTVHFLENDAVIIDGVRFLGTALWTDFDLFGAARREAAMQAAQEYMTDYRRISAGPPGPHNKRPPLTPAHTRERHVESRAWLEQRLAEPHDGKTVVVTHFLPGIQSVAGRFRGEITSAAFASDFDAQMGQAALWIHGHTHDSFDYLLNGTRVVCNPRGYCEFRGNGIECENPSFEPDKTVEV